MTEIVASQELSVTEKKEREFLRKLMGLRKVSANAITFYLKPKRELFVNFGISITIKKRRMVFYGHLKSLEAGGIFLTFQENIKTQVR